MMTDETLNTDEFEKELGRHRGETVLASLDREALKRFFYVFAARPDSRVKLFTRPITIVKQDLLDLNSMMSEKLRLHRIQAAVTRISIAFKKRELLEFGSWDDYEKYNFDEPTPIEHLSVVWDLLFKLDDNPIPCRHTVTLRIASELTPAQVLHTIMSQDYDAIESLEINAAPCMVRVDFINSRLSDEIVELVKKWNEGRRKAIEERPTLSWMKRQKDKVAPIVHYVLPACLVILSIFSLGRMDRQSIGALQLVHFGYWAIVTVVAVFLGNKIGLRMGRKVFRSLSDIGKLPIFQITRGDKTRCDEIAQENIKGRRSIIVLIMIDLFIGVITGISSGLILKSFW